MRARFHRWSGTQDPFPADVSADAVMDAIAEDLLEGTDPSDAIDRLLRQGLEGRMRGLDELRRRLEQARRAELDRLGVEAPLRDAEERLAEILERERTAVHFEADPDLAALKEQQLDDLPEGIASRLQALDDYRWTDAKAGADFRALREELRRDVAEATFGRLSQALGQATPADVARMRDMLAELNGLMERQARGEDVDADFQRFKERYPEVVGDAETLDEFLADLARRMAAASRLMASMDPEMRAQLAEMAAELFDGDEELAFQAQQLAGALAGRFPGLGWGEAVPGAMPTGATGGSVSGAVEWMEHLQEYEDLGRALGQRYPGASLADVDPEALRRALGEDAVRDYRALREVEHALEQAGAMQRRHGRMELTPRGVRRLGERSLAKIYERAVSGRIGAHDARRSGGDGELTGATRPLRFGDPFRLHVGRTIGNAITRQAGTTGHRSIGTAGVRLAPEDFELAEAEQRVRVATVLLLDMSFSMPLRGNWVPAKRVALALQALISSQFPEDHFSVIGFSDYARRLEPRDLLVRGWERVYGTNMQHAFMLARRALAATPGAHQQVIMVTDGEPTAHLEGDVPWFSWPPHPRTLQLTMAEAARLARTGATLNVFLLDHDPGAARFIERMVGSYGGRIFYPDLDNLGDLVVRDFLSGRR